MQIMKELLIKWIGEEKAVAATEAAMIFPIMLTLFMGVYDAGNAILANQKTIRASQVVADLITRENTVSDSDVNEAIEAGRLAFEPLANQSYGVDIASVSFDENANSQIEWRETQGMSSLPDVLTAVEPLESPDEGVVMVSVEYQFVPKFTGFVFGTIDMQEVAFSRGRSTPVVTHE